MQSLLLSARKALIVAVAMLGFAGLAQAQATNASPAAGDQSQCVACHKDASDSLTMTRHGVKGDARTPVGSGKACESCHTNAAEHLKNPTGSKPLTFKKTVDAHDRAAPCETCHQGKARIHWVGSAHERSDVACNDCHKVHKAKDQVMVAETQAGVCYDCHKDVRAASMRASTHPLKTGWMPCSSCHQPHGSVGEANLIKASVNETCYTCHADKRGPFLWPHPPAAENCANCHGPHGTNNRPMLLTRGPFLCQQCHAGSNHPSTAYSGSNLPPSTGGAQTLGQNCMNCHPKIHGSNHPSGARFTR